VQDAVLLSGKNVRPTPPTYLATDRRRGRNRRVTQAGGHLADQGA